jgi:hypothetical protein
MVMKITADTITSDQLKRLHDEAAFETGDRRTEAEARAALNDHGLHDRVRVLQARARCAEILNTRSRT